MSDESREGDGDDHRDRQRRDATALPAAGGDAPALELDGVHVRYGDRSVLEGVSLSVESGEFLALVGPNGAGKTTLLRAVNGLVEPDAGTVRLAGTAASALSAHERARRVATVPQETSVGFDFPVWDVVAMGRTAHRSRLSRAGEADREAVTRALARTETERFADRSVGSLSGGERQRVVVARALAQGAPLLLLDEPTASLDISHQVGVLGLVESLVADGLTAVAAIHDLDLAARFCDRIALLTGGELLAVGPPEEVLTEARVADAYDVAAVVDESPVTGTPTVTALRTGPADPGERAPTAPPPDRPLGEADDD